MGAAENVAAVYFWTKATPSEIRAIAVNAGPEFQYVVGSAPGGAITLVMGFENFKEMQKRGCIPKNKGLEASRGQVFEADFGKFLVTFDPGRRHVEADTVAQIVWDIRLARRFVATGSLKPVLGKYQWADDFSDLIADVNDKFVETGQPVEVAVDTETMGLFPWYPDKHIVTVQASMTPGTATCVYTLGMPQPLLGQFIAQLRWLLTTPKVKIRGANWKYDAIWLYVKWQIDCMNFTMDTTAVGSLLDENAGNSLKWHVKQHVDGLGGYDDELVSKYDMGHMEVIPKEVLLNYAAPDADGTLQVAQVFKKKLGEERLLQHFYVKLLHPALKAFEKIERRGVLYDKDRAADLGKKVTAYIAEKEHHLVGMLGSRLRAKYADKIADNLAQGKSPLTAAVLKDHFFDKDIGMGLNPVLITPKSEEPSTAYEHLVMFEEHGTAKEFVSVFKELGVARKTRSTYLDGFHDHLRPDDRFHATYMLFNGDMFDDESDDGGTNTGRLSCKGPALQTLPKHTYWAKMLRYCYIAPPGHLCWSMDYSQGELRIMACLANVKKMLDAYMAEKDLHVITGSMFAGMDADAFALYANAPKGSSERELYDYRRQSGKHANFGMIFEISAGGFQVYCRRKGLLITDKQAQDYIDQFFALYPEIRTFHGTQKTFARQHGVVANPFGRIRHLPLIKSPNGKTRGHAERQSINAPIQSCLSDICVRGATRVEQELGDQASVVGLTHDQAYGYVREDRMHELLPQIRELMTEKFYVSDFGWDPPLDFPVDIEVGPDMAHLEKYRPMALAA